eukprot:TRINITY_DN30187_c0_g1_i1.p1 TRINITY_DN30187_c0_g1~~TRINITY_DN30187_c0_g1_i1.p1  ORF type:complete len:252 (+),score=27.10 TRINITY_DN30187_c0_g1_i1:46-801(+)
MLSRRAKEWVLRKVVIETVCSSGVRREMATSVWALTVLRQMISMDNLVDVISWVLPVAQYSTLMSYDVAVEDMGRRVWQGRRAASGWFAAAIEPSVPAGWQAVLKVRIPKDVTSTKKPQVGIAALPTEYGKAALLFDGSPLPDNIPHFIPPVMDFPSDEIITISANPQRSLVTYSSAAGVFRYKYVFPPASRYSFLTVLSTTGEALCIVDFTMAQTKPVPPLPRGTYCAMAGAVIAAFLVNRYMYFVFTDF